MKSLLKNYLFRSKVLLLSAFFLSAVSTAQIANYINNGSFEDIYSCDGPSFSLSVAKYWLSIDSSSFAGVYRSTCNSKVPVNAAGFQYPHFGNSYALTTMYCLLPGCPRGYPKNRLKATLKQGVKYCVKFHISIANESPRGMDGFGIYFGDASIDTINYCEVPLSYITPQVKNPLGNVISDTLNWTAVTGTFIATGTEKYALIGNFLADNAVATTSINTPSYPQHWTDVYIDDVSCIEMDLPAYAGPDKTVIPGNSVFIGCEPDYAIDPGCMWYKLPDMTTAIDTISGLWVSPTETSTYVVRQELECSSVKWDTVVVHINGVGFEEFKFKTENLKVYPVPAGDYFELRITNEELFKEFKRIAILNSLGQIVREEELTFKDKSAKINIADLANGAYFIQVKNSSNEELTKKLLIAK